MLTAGMVLIARPNNTVVQVSLPPSTESGGESVLHKSDRLPLPVITKPKKHKHRIGPPLVIVPSYYLKRKE